MKGNVAIILIIIGAVSAVVYSGTVIIPNLPGFSSFTGLATYSGPGDCGAYVDTSSTLTGDVGPCLINGLNFNASNIILDCQSHSIIGTPGASFFGLNFTGFDNITIKNCIITDFQSGLHVNDTENSTFINLQILNSTGSGMAINFTRFSEINDSFINNSGDDGIDLHYCLNNTVAFNNISYSYTHGIHLAGTNGTAIMNNTITMTNGTSLSTGIYTSSGSDPSSGNQIGPGNLIEYAVIGMASESFDPANVALGNRITENIIMYGARNDDGDGYGISEYLSSYGVISGNTIGYFPTGILMGFGGGGACTDNTISFNSIDNCGTVALQLELGSTANTIYRNEFGAGNVVYGDDQAGGNTYSSGGQGNYYPDCGTFNADTWDTNHDTYADTGPTYTNLNGAPLVLNSWVDPACYVAQENFEPTLSGIDTNPTSPKTADDVSWHVTASDANGHTPLTVDYTILKNGNPFVTDSLSVTQGVDTIFYVISSADTAKGDTFSLTSITASDPFSSSPSDSDSVDISNTPPTTPTGLSLTDPVYVTGTLTGTGSGSTDADPVDSITYYYRFWNNDDASLIKDWSTDDNIVIGVSEAHDEIEVRVKANDGTDDSPGDFPDTVTVSNTAPTAPTISYGPGSVYVSTEVDVDNAGSADADGDPMIYEYRFVSSILGTVQDWSTDDTYSVTQPEAHGIMTIYTRTNDGAYGGVSPEDTDTINILNTAPTAPTDIAFVPDSATVGVLITFTASGSTDADGDLIEYKYRVYNVDDAVERVAWGTTNTYTPVADDSGDTLRFEASTNDGIYGGTSGTYNEDKGVGNTKPDFSLGTVTVTTDPVDEGATATAQVSGMTDADNDDLTVEYCITSTPPCVPGTDAGVTISTPYPDTPFTFTAPTVSSDTLYTIYVRVKDTEESADTKSDDFTVTDIPAPPAPTPPPSPPTQTHGGGTPTEVPVPEPEPLPEPEELEMCIYEWVEEYIVVPKWESWEGQPTCVAGIRNKAVTDANDCDSMVASGTYAGAEGDEKPIDGLVREPCEIGAPCQSNDQCQSRYCEKAVRDDTDMFATLFLMLRGRGMQEFMERASSISLQIVAPGLTENYAYSDNPWPEIGPMDSAYKEWGYCQIPSCEDGIMNGNEECIDGGGICPATCKIGMTPEGVYKVEGREYNLGEASGMVTESYSDAMWDFAGIQTKEIDPVEFKGDMIRSEDGILAAGVELIEPSTIRVVFGLESPGSVEFNLNQEGATIAADIISISSSDILVATDMLFNDMYYGGSVMFVATAYTGSGSSRVFIPIELPEKAGGLVASVRRQLQNNVNQLSRAAESFRVSVTGLAMKICTGSGGTFNDAEGCSVDHPVGEGGVELGERHVKGCNCKFSILCECRAYVESADGPWEEGLDAEKCKEAEKDKKDVSVGPGTTTSGAGYYGKINGPDFDDVTIGDILWYQGFEFYTAPAGECQNNDDCRPKCSNQADIIDIQSKAASEVKKDIADRGLTKEGAEVYCKCAASLQSYQCV